MSAQLTAADVLERAADKLTPDGAWTQGDWAKNAEGESVEPTSPDATCWCVRGALAAASGDEYGIYGPASEYVERLVQLPVHWNDTPGRTQSEVVAKLREAAALARAEAA